MFHRVVSQQMLADMEQKVASLSALGPVSDQQQQGELGAVGSQPEDAELLASKLDRLKADLVSFQRLLQDGQGEDTTDHTEQVRTYGPDRRLTACVSAQRGRSDGVVFPQSSERPPQAQMKRSSSVQEMFSSPKNQLLRQSSLQQQKVPLPVHWVNMFSLMCSGNRGSVFMLVLVLVLVCVSSCRSWSRS